MIKRLLIFTALLLIAAQVAYADITSNLVVRWPMDNGSGTTITDTSGNGHTGTFGTNNPTWLSGANCKMSACLGFANANQSVTFTAITSGTTFTWATWIYPITGTDTWAWLLAQAGIEAIFYTNTGVNAGNVLFDGGFYNTTPLTPNAWQHVALVSNAGSGTWYLNGVADGTGTVATVDYNTIADTSGGFTGRLDDMWLFSRALSAGDIAELIALATPASAKKRILSY